MISSDSAALGTSHVGQVPLAPNDRVLPDGDSSHRTDVNGEAHVAADTTASAADTANVALRRMAGLRAAINLPDARPEQDEQQVELADVTTGPDESAACTPDQQTLGNRAQEPGGHPDACRARDEPSEDDEPEDADLSDRDWSTEAESEPPTEPESDFDRSDLFSVLHLVGAMQGLAMGPPSDEESDVWSESESESESEPDSPPPSGSPPEELPPPGKRPKTWNQPSGA